MGRHTTPGTGTPEPDRGFWIRLAAAAAVVVLIGVFFLVRSLGGDETTTTAGPRDTPSSTASSDDPAMTASTPTESSVVSAPSATPTTRPPTLEFVVLRKTYITVRVPGGRTLVSRLFHKGASRSFDQKRLQVVNGRPSAVRFTVNGSPHKPGPAGETEIFTVRRR